MTFACTRRISEGREFDPHSGHTLFLFLFLFYVCLLLEFTQCALVHGPVVGVDMCKLINSFTNKRSFRLLLLQSTTRLEPSEIINAVFIFSSHPFA